MMIPRSLTNIVLTKLRASDKGIVIYGARQVGKTTLVNDVVQHSGLKTLTVNADQSKYLDIYEDRKNNDSGTESILDQIDFELELTVRDIINFDYIIQLIAGLKNISSKAVREKKTEEILRLFDRDVKLRKKKELIKKFIEENLPKISKSDNVEKEFNKFWSSERSDALKKIAQTEKISHEKIEQLIGDYLYTQRLPNGQEIVELLPETPRILERQGIIDRIKNAIENIVDMFEW